jgi:3-isopropylmalate dehydrogenase
VEAAVHAALDAGVFTADLAGDRSRAVGTRAVTAAVLEQLELPCQVMELRD